MKKRIIIAALSALLACGVLSGCGGDSQNATNSETSTVETAGEKLQVGDSITLDEWDISVTGANTKDATYLSSANEDLVRVRVFLSIKNNGEVPNNPFSEYEFGTRTPKREAKLFFQDKYEYYPIKVIDADDITLGDIKPLETKKGSIYFDIPLEANDPSNLDFSVETGGKENLFHLSKYDSALGKYKSIEEYIEKEDLKNHVEQMNYGNQIFGETVLAEKNSLVYEFKWKEQEDATSIRNTFEKYYGSGTDAEKNQEKQAALLKDTVAVKNPTVTVRCLNKDGSVIYERIYDSSGNSKETTPSKLSSANTTESTDTAKNTSSSNDYEIKQLKQKTTFGNFEVMVMGTNTISEISDACNTFVPHDIGSEYCLVYIHIKNLGTEYDTFLSSIADEKAPKFNLIIDDKSYIPTTLVGYSQELHGLGLNPSESVTANVVFVVPKENEPIINSPTTYLDITQSNQSVRYVVSE